MLGLCLPGRQHPASGCGLGLELPPRISMTALWTDVWHPQVPFSFCPVTQPHQVHYNMGRGCLPSNIDLYQACTVKRAKVLASVQDRLILVSSLDNQLPQLVDGFRHKNNVDAQNCSMQIGVLEVEHSQQKHHTCTAEERASLCTKDEHHDTFLETHMTSRGLQPTFRSNIIEF